MTCLLSGLSTHPAASNATITVNTDARYQTITGWEATAQAGQSDCAGFPVYQDELFKRAVNELGINRLRLEVRSGVENPRDWWSEYRSGAVDYPTWRAVRYDPSNDNSDPNVINWGGFQFSGLDHHIETVVLPMKEQLELRGETLFLNVNYVSFLNKNTTSRQDVHFDPQEYAEFVLAVHLHMKEKYGLVPDSWEVILEPDNVPGWDGAAIGNAILASVQRLQENGFHAVFIAPSTTSMEAASQYFDQMIAVPGVLDYLNEFSYHRYRNVSKENLEMIASRASQYGVNTSMLEHIESDHHDLYEDLKTGNVSAWQQFTLAFCIDDDDGSAYYIIDNKNPEQPVVRLSERSRYLLQYFHYIHAGAIRIGAKSNTKNFKPLAFINPTGETVLVIIADSGGELRLQELPAGSYRAHYTTAAETHAETAVILEGQQWLTSIPAEGVITIHQMSQSSPEETEAGFTPPATKTTQSDIVKPVAPTDYAAAPVSTTIPLITEEPAISSLPSNSWILAVGGLGIFTGAFLLSVFIFLRVRR